METHKLTQARSLQRAGRLEEAVIVLESLLAAEPGNAVALIQLADCQIRRHHPEEALQELDRAEEAAGVTARTARLRGDALYRLDRARDAARAYDEADALGDRGTWVLLQLARCRLRLRDLEGARGAAARAVERQPTEARAWTVLGDVAARAGQHGEAELHYRRAHELRPEDQHAYARLIEARLEQLDPQDRCRELDVLLRSGGSGNRHLVAVLARMRRQLGDEPGAVLAWRQSRRSPEDLYARKQEAYALRRAHRLDEAAAALRDCLLEDPHDIVLFRTYVGMQRRREALDELRQTLQDLLPLAGRRKGPVYGELRKLESA